MDHSLKTSIPQLSELRQSGVLLLVVLVFFSTLTSTVVHAANTDLEQFKVAWQAARQGDHDTFNQVRKTLGNHVLYPYLQYEDYRNRRATVPVAEMAAFLDSHQAWAFTPGLRNAWLKSLAKRGRWADLVAHSEGVSDTVLRCQRVRGQIILKQMDGVLAEAQRLWAVGQSQPAECDPVFAWLSNHDGIPTSLAWERIRLAIEADNRRLTIYLARFVPADQRVWLEDWQQHNRAGYKRLHRLRRWPDNEITQMITIASLQRLAHRDAALAAIKFEQLDGHFGWGEERRFALLRDIALYSAVGLEDETSVHMERVPVTYRDSQLLEWWARFLLSQQDWAGLAAVIRQMPEELMTDDRWRYWLAQAELRSTKDTAPSQALEVLAEKANYYGFLAADELGIAYNICPQQPEIDAAAIDRVAAIDGFERALELKKAGLENWAVSEWSLASRRLPVADLKVAAALAQREDWPDRAIFALGNSGDLRFYEWRFPLLWEKEIKHAAAANNLDPAWVYGTIRSESAMVEGARSSANALGLMQITPATGKRVARKHKLAWRGSSQLKTVAGNLQIGTAFMSDLLQDFRHNLVMASAAYNAGPNVIERWLETRPLGEAAIWVETLPYFETRDYIPRVLAFTTLYDWRLGGKVERISGRMPHIESGKIAVNGTVKVVCREQNNKVVSRN